MKQQHTIGSGWILALFAILTVALSGFALTSPVWYDDAGHWIVLRSWFDTGALCYPHDPAMGNCQPHAAFITLGPAVYYPAIAWSVLTGYDMPIIRLLMVVAGVLAGIGYFLSVQTFRNTVVAFVSVMLGCLNIQYLTYGSQFLGEVPMLGFLFLTLVQLYKLAGKDQPWTRAMLAGLGAGLAILSKEYALAIVGWWYAGALGWLMLSRQIRAIGPLLTSGALALGLWALWNFVAYGSISAWISGLQARSSYSGEFLVFDWHETLPFLLKKPVIWLGAVAMGLRLWSRRTLTDAFLIWCWFGQLLFFLFSAGYDRFGFQLVFIPAIFLAEFVLFGWRFSRHTSAPVFWRTLLLLATFAVASQRALPTLFMRWQHPEQINSAEKQVNEFLLRNDFSAVFTYDQQLLPFLNDGIGFRLADMVPSAAAREPAMLLRDQEVFISGPYAETEYQHSINWNSLEMLFRTNDGTYTVYRQREGNFFASSRYGKRTHME